MVISGSSQALYRAPLAIPAQEALSRLSLPTLPTLSQSEVLAYTDFNLLLPLKGWSVLCIPSL